ncbi:ComF family protein [Labrenzia sp. VG12]|uniref:ComF family protein n=1 Tax=Labrenzia sp. VG12 TaxID=2021862 RepID=UPI000B8C271B|nr:ComF family protein [Labrenzia sp. VG12]ASP36932.1 phosphoribosyltransferase [Labrenzia sp. VG12]
MVICGERLLDVSKYAGSLLLDGLLPRRCLCCDARVAFEAGLCAPCWRAMPFLERPWCQRLGTPFSYDVGEGAWSPRAIAEPPLFDRLRAVAHYDGPARQLVLSLKFSRRRELAAPMAAWMMRSGGELLDAECLLLPVPLHWTRLVSRRFNQAADLAREIAGQSGAGYEPVLLKRRKRTRQQVGLTAKDRLRNVRAAFVVDRTRLETLAGRRVVLVDDVLTTGSTVTACSRCLLSAGAASVDVLTFALVDPNASDDIAVHG